MSEPTQAQRLYAFIKGTGPKTIVLLHGFGGFHGVWSEIQPGLVQGAGVLAYDLPGHHRSLSYPNAGPAGVAVKAILADLQARGITRAHFVGHSMGGAIASLIGLRAPEVAESLTLLAPGGFGPEINADLLRRYGAATNADELRSCLNEMSAPGFAMPTKCVVGLAASRGARGQREKLVEIAAAITKGERQGEIPRDMLATLTMPVTVVWGTEDTVLPFSQTQDLPLNFKLEVLAGRGHMLMEEARETVLRIIRRTTR
ncbi:alpha/beta fold hydrolase [Tianweitania populi]|uniref:Dihydrolipoamide acetyltransferase n=1 Tax=Tianweitania populi TaxID=1607949 RepID=A0A8J3DPJ5_9HYPH|nr:alpha/beta fold hydrolase [Tianweitania populi]GHD11934.1 dihydrolipoamide acetyltransferase [Tianweitania populi]